MLGYLFGFNARIGRMQYFLGTLGLGFATALVMFAIVGQAFRSAPTNIALNFGWPAVITIVIFTWVNFTLQSMRFRDIGWDPVCVIPAWIALLIIDRLVATKFPALAFGHNGHGTFVGAVVHFGMILALIFWPSADPDGPAFDEPRHTPPRSRDPVSPAANRIARVANGEFGRRAG